LKTFQRGEQGFLHRVLDLRQVGIGRKKPLKTDIC